MNFTKKSLRLYAVTDRSWLPVSYTHLDVYKRQMLYSTKDIEEIFQMVAGWDVDGVIAISFSRHNCEKIYQLIKKPIVSIDAYGNAAKDSHLVNIGLDLSLIHI